MYIIEIPKRQSYLRVTALKSVQSFLTVGTTKIKKNRMKGMERHEVIQEAQLLLGDRATRKHAKDC